MADFDQAYQVTCGNEGGYANDPHDSGGETFMGISRNNFPHWIGWGLVDELKRQPNFPHNLKECQPLLDAVKNFFRQAFWIPIAGTALASQDLANKLYDAAVNMGTGTAVRLLQEALGVDADGIMGSHSIGAANTPPFDATIEAFRDRRIAHYKQIVADHPEDARFLDLWLSRC